MTATFEQEPDPLSTRAPVLVGLVAVALTAALVWVAWLCVTPAPRPLRPPSQGSTLEHGLFETAHGGEALQEAGARRLDIYRWVDRPARVVQLPIDRAIDAVVADPELIGRRFAPAEPK